MSLTSFKFIERLHNAAPIDERIAEGDRADDALRKLQGQIDALQGGVSARQPPYFQPLSGTMVSIPLPPGILAANVTVYDSDGYQQSVVIRHISGAVVIEALDDMTGLIARFIY